MNIVVCIKQVPDTETKIQIAGDSLNTQGVKWVMNPYDEFAVEEALKFKALKPSALVTVISLGPKARVVESLRTALAMGADEAIVIDAPESADNNMAAKGLAAAIKGLGELAMVFTGKLAIDDNASAVTQMLAEHLGLAHATGVTKAEYKDATVLVEREADGGSRELIELKLPAVVGANKGLNTPRYASLPGIMKAKKKVIKELTLEGLAVGAADQKLKYSGYALPPDRPAVKMLAGDAAAQSAQLTKLLREEAKVV